MTKEEQLQQLNSLLDNQSPQSIDKKEIDLYMSLVRDLTKERMLAVIASPEGEREKLLKDILPIQTNLMKVRMMSANQIPEDLWEVARDFDHDDPRGYSYLVDKICKRGYLLLKD